ncbi:siderophore-interacting protein [Streptomyces sp. NPDC052309]|uniref:siderophore-interacting protein n=1 Tax=Streptomyces sp. NPDC052309 TaxID=3155421 RepID=UPI00341BBA2C
MGQGRGWEGAVLKLMRAKDYEFTVTGAEDVTPAFRRLHLTDGGMLAATGVHPTMWVRLWFENAGRPHQRAYTLVDPDPAAGTFSMEFALHEGCASDWARAAKPGDTIEATVQGTGFQTPDPAPSHVFAVADPASLPALNSLLGTLGEAPATVWFEGGADDGLPFRTDPARHDVRAVPRRDAGAHLVAQVKEALPALLGSTPDPYVWIACDTATTRALASYVRKELGLPKQRVNALGYWRAT